MDYSGPERRQSTSNDLKVAEHLGAINASLKALHHQLLGNGQPGRIQVLEKQVAAHSKLIWTVGGAVTFGFHAGKEFFVKYGPKIWSLITG